MIPHTFDVVIACEAYLVPKPGRRFNEERLFHVPGRPDQHPGVQSETTEFIRRWFLQLLNNSANKGHNVSSSKQHEEQ